MKKTVLYDLSEDRLVALLICILMYGLANLAIVEYVLIQFKDRGVA